MTKHREHIFYRWLLRLYPLAYRQSFGEPMVETFGDLYRARRQAGKTMLPFLAWVYLETGWGVLRENLTALSARASSPSGSLLTACLMTLPFLLTNATIANRWEPVNTWIRNADLNNAAGFGPGFFLVLGLLLLLPAGAAIAIGPKPAQGTRKLRLPNVLVAALLLLGFVFVSSGLGQDIYQCDFLQIPNCD